MWGPKQEKVQKPGVLHLYCTTMSTTMSHSVSTLYKMCENFSTTNSEANTGYIHPRYKNRFVSIQTIHVLFVLA